MIDLHCHLLHGIDDGPKSIEESVELCRIAAQDGITHAVVTPHVHPGRWENSCAAIARQCDTLRKELARYGVPLQLGYAGEVRLTDQIMSQVENDEIPYYGEVEGYRVMLLEFPHGHIIPGSYKLVEWLMGNSIRPIIAHPERNKQVMKDVEHLRAFVSAGCWLQVTAGSVTGRFGEQAQSTAHQLLRDDVVKVIASDGHNAGARRPILKEAFTVIAREYGDRRANQLFVENPAYIVSRQFSEAPDVESLAQ